MKYFIGLLVICAVVWLFIKRSPTKQPADTTTGTAKIPRIRGNGRFSVEVVGESHYHDTFVDLLGDQAGTEHEVHCDAMLVLEDGNPHDKNAVAVQIEGKTVGYLARKMAIEFRQAIARDKISQWNGYAVAARIYCGGADEMFSVRVDLPET